MKQRSRSSVNGLRRECCEGRRTVAGKANGRRFEGRQTVAGMKEGERSPGCEWSPLSLIGDGWLLTELHRRRFELHRRRFELHRRRLSLIVTVGVQRRRWELNRDGAVKLNRDGLALCFFFFFLNEIWL